MPNPENLAEDRLVATLPVDSQGRPSVGGVSLLRKLGAGGMGAVYLGVQEGLGRQVAVKILPFNLADSDPRLVKRFGSEAKLAAAIESPHVVKVIDAGCDYGTHYFVMEYVAGESAGALLKRRAAAGHRGLPEAEALRILAGATRGLAAAHASGIVHRDVKPDNILIPGGNLDAAKLGDLGLAKPEGGVQTAGTLSNVAMGTPGFMAPEQAENAKAAGPAADVFAMGATLYALLTGEPPFGGSSLVAVLRAAEKGWYRELPGTVSAGVRWLVERCLQGDPSSRFKDGAALLAAVDKVRANPAAAGSRPAPTGSASLEVASLPGARKRSPWGLLAVAGLAVVAAALAIAFIGRGRKPAADGATAAAREPESIDDLLARAESLGRDGKFGEALAALDLASAKVPGDARIAPLRKRISSEAAAAKAASERADRFRDFLAATEAARFAADVQDTTEAWDKVLAAADSAMDNASPADESKVSALQLEARARRGWAAARTKAKEGDLAGALELAQTAAGIAPGTPGLDAWVKELQGAIAKTKTESDRRREYLEAVALAEKEQDPSKAAELWDAVSGKTEVSSERERAQAKARELRDSVASARTAQLLAEAHAGAEKAIAAGDFEAAGRSLADAERIQKGNEATAALRIRLDEAKSGKAYDAAMAEAEKAEKEGNLAAAAAAVQRALDARPRDQRALAKAADLKDRAFSIRPVAKAGRIEFEISPGVRMEFVQIKPAVFTTGEGKDERRVTLTKGYAMQTTEVTQAQWKSLMTIAHFGFQGDQRPAEQVNWWLVQDFIDRLNERLVGWTATLPSSAEWEYACRAGTKGAWGSGATAETLGEYAWHLENADGHTHEVAKLKPNAWGLYDMHGNVWELCWDWESSKDYVPEAVDPAGPGGGGAKIARGGSWDRNASDHRLSYPGAVRPDQEFNYVGFRLVLVQGEEGPPHVRRMTVNLGDGAKKVPMEFAQIKAGWFDEGLPDGKTGEQIHKVTLTRDFWIATTETTQAQWEAVMGERNFDVEGPELPAIGITWDETQEYLKKLAVRARPRIPALPTEAEWEYACRAGTAYFAWPSGHEAEQTRAIGWTSLNAKALQPVRQLRPNLWGLYDMTGNAFEWCQDWYAPFTTDSLTDPTGPKNGTERVLRGGSWADLPGAARSGQRDKVEPARIQHNIGFRAVLRDK